MLGGLCVAAMFPVALLLAAAKDSNAPASITGVHTGSLVNEQFSCEQLRARHMLAVVESHDRTRRTEEINNALCIKQVLPAIHLQPQVKYQVLAWTTLDIACATL